MLDMLLNWISLASIFRVCIGVSQMIVAQSCLAWPIHKKGGQVVMTQRCCCLRAPLLLA